MDYRYSPPWCGRIGLGNWGFGLKGKGILDRMKVHTAAGIAFLVLFLAASIILNEMGIWVHIWVASILVTAGIGMAFIGEVFPPSKRRDDSPDFIGGCIFFGSLIVGCFFGPLYMAFRGLIFCIDLAQVIYEGSNGPYAVPNFAISKLTEEQALALKAVKENVSLMSEEIRGKKESWNHEITPFSFEKALEAMGVFVAHTNECFQTKLIACLWTADRLAAERCGRSITGFLYEKTGIGLLPIGFKKLSELPVFSISKKQYGEYIGNVYSITKRIGTSHLSSAELSIIAEVVDALQNLDTPALKPYLDVSNIQGDIIGFIDKQKT